MKHFFLIFSLAVLTISCGSDDDGGATDDGPEPFNEPTTAGLSYSNSTSDFSTTYNGIRSTLQNNPNITVVDQLDHSANASSIGEDLRPTRIIFFGNPALGTPIMQENQLAGLDLPQHILVYQNSSNEVIATFNSTNYLVARHNVGGASTLQTVQQALSDVVSGTTTNEVFSNIGSGINGSPGLVTIVSNNDFQTTVNNLQNEINDDQNLTELFSLDHSANASSVDMQLRPTTVFVFGNETLETPLMQDSQITGLDLPQKMLVWEDADGDVNVSYTTPDYLMNRHDISDAQSQVIDDITSDLNNLAISASN